MKVNTRDAKQAPSYAHWHAEVSYPGGTSRKTEGTFWRRDDAKEHSKAMRELEGLYGSRSVHWCTAPVGLGGQCWPSGERS